MIRATATWGWIEGSRGAIFLTALPSLLVGQFSRQALRGCMVWARLIRASLLRKIQIIIRRH